MYSQHLVAPTGIDARTVQGSSISLSFMICFRRKFPKQKEKSPRRLAFKHVFLNQSQSIYHFQVSHFTQPQLQECAVARKKNKQTDNCEMKQTVSQGAAWRLAMAGLRQRDRLANAHTHAHTHTVGAGCKGTGGESSFQMSGGIYG